MAGAFVEPGKELIISGKCSGFALRDIQGVLVGPGRIGPVTQQSQDLCFLRRRINYHKDEVEGAPAFYISLVIHAQVCAGFEIGVLNHKFTGRIVITGGEEIMSQPGNLTRVVRLVIPFFDQHGVAAGDQALDQLDIASVADDDVIVRFIGHKISHFVGHDVLIPEALLNKIQCRVLDTGFDHPGDVIAVSWPPPEIKRHREVSRPAVVPAVVLVDILNAVKDHQLGQGRRGDGGGLGGVGGVRRPCS